MKNPDQLTSGGDTGIQDSLQAAAAVLALKVLSHSGSPWNPLSSKAFLARTEVCAEVVTASAASSDSVVSEYGTMSYQEV